MSKLPIARPLLRGACLAIAVTVMAAAVTASAAIIWPAGPALAQRPGLKPFPLGGARQATSRAGEVRISVTYRFFIEGNTDTMADQTKLADRGRKHLYLMLAKECVVLKETIASTCAIQRASVNAQLSRKSRLRSRGVRISGSASYRIELKPDHQAPDHQAPDRKTKNE